MVQPENDKPHIGWKEVCQRTGVSKSTICRWERDDLIPKASRRFTNNARIWTEVIIQKIIEVRHREKEPPSPPPTAKKKK